MDEVGHPRHASRVRARVGPHRDGARRGHPRPRVLGARGDGGAPGADRGGQPARERDRHAADARGRAARRRRGRRGRAARRPARAADRGQGPRGHRGDADDLRLAAVRRARAGGRLAAGRAPARRGRDRDRQDEHARVRRRVADVQRGLRGDAQPVGPVADAGRVQRRRGGRGRGAGCCRSPTAPTSAPASATRPRSATSSACGPRRAGSRTPARAIRGTRSRCSGRSRARSTTSRCCCRRSRAPTRATRCRSAARFAPELATATCAGCGSRWSRDLGGLPVDPAVTAVLERAAGDARGARLRRRGRRAVDFEGADECFEVLRGVTFAGAFKEILHQVKPTLAENIRFGLSLTPERIARALALRGELFTRMREFLSATTCSPRRSRRSRRSASRTSTRARSRASRWAPTSSGSAPARGSRSPRTRRSRCRRGSRRDGLPIGLQLVGRHRGEAALLRLARGVHRGDRAAERTPEL